MSSPTPLPPATPDATAQAAARQDAAGDAVAMADSTPAVAQQTVPAAQKLVRLAAGLACRPPYAAALLAALTYGAVHFLAAKYPPSKLKLASAGAFAAIVYGLAALRDQDPAIGAKGLRVIANAATASSNLSLTRRLLAAWYVTFPAIALGAACVRQLTPITMVLVAGGVMMLPAILQSQGVSM